MSKKPLRCHDCGQPFARKPGADLCCGPDCEENRLKAANDIKSQLLALGFEQHSEAPNQFVKDGASVTLEEVKHGGLDNAIVRHGQVSELRDVAGATQGRTA